jgi:tetratricopeptide (TPR) repeat protein
MNAVTKPLKLVLLSMLLLPTMAVWAADDLTSRYEQARQLYQQGQLKQAESLYRDLLDEYPKLPELYNNLAVVLVADGRLEEAKDVLQDGLRSQSVFASMYDNLLNINSSLSRQLYLQALLPVDEIEPGVKDLDSLSEFAQLYYPTNESIGQTKVSEGVQNKRAGDSVILSAIKDQESKAEPVKTVITQIKPDSKTANVARLTQLAQSGDAPLMDHVPPIMNLEHEISTALNHWVDAWSAKDSQAYINSYVENYRPDKNTTHTAWVKQRQSRLARPKWIKVSIDKVQYFILDANRVAVQLRQRYRSDTYNDVTQKELVLIRVDGSWKIEQENSL